MGFYRLRSPFVFISRSLVVSMLLCSSVFATSGDSKGPVDVEYTPPAPSLAVAFSDLGRSLIEARTGLDARWAVTLDAQQAGVAPSTGDPSSLHDDSQFRLAQAPRRSMREAVRYETRLVGSEILPGADLTTNAGNASANDAQARARQAVVDAIADTSLGRSVGRVLFFRQTNGIDPNRSRLIPLVSPKLHYRSRTAGVSLIWRF